MNDSSFGRQRSRAGRPRYRRTDRLRRSIRSWDRCYVRRIACDDQGCKGAEPDGGSASSPADGSRRIGYVGLEARRRARPDRRAEGDPTPARLDLLPLHARTWVQAALHQQNSRYHSPARYPARSIPESLSFTKRSLLTALILLARLPVSPTEPQVLMASCSAPLRPAFVIPRRFSHSRRSAGRVVQRAYVPTGGAG